MNAIDLLEKQHEEVLTLLTQLEKSKAGARRKESFKELQKSLLAHMVIEEDIFYPAVTEQADEGEPVAEGYEEHAGARSALQRCARAISADELFQVRIGVLKEQIEHHLKEERSEIFGKARETMEAEELEALGVQMEQRFEEAQAGRSPSARLDRMCTAREREALRP